MHRWLDIIHKNNDIGHFNFMSSGPNIKFAKTNSDKVMSYVTQLGGFNDKSVQKNDLLLMYVRLDKGAFVGEEVVEPAEQAIVNLGTEVDLRYRYTARIEEEHYSDNEGCEEC